MKREGCDREGELEREEKREGERRKGREKEEEREGERRREREKEEEGEGERRRERRRTKEGEGEREEGSEYLTKVFFFCSLSSICVHDKDDMSSTDISLKKLKPLRGSLFFIQD